MVSAVNNGHFEIANRFFFNILTTKKKVDEVVDILI
jgi:hypothetical protein